METFVTHKLNLFAKSNNKWDGTTCQNIPLNIGTSSHIPIIKFTELFKILQFVILVFAKEIRRFLLKIHWEDLIDSIVPLSLHGWNSMSVKKWKMNICSYNYSKIWMGPSRAHSRALHIRFSLKVKGFFQNQLSACFPTGYTQIFKTGAEIWN